MTKRTKTVKLLSKAMAAILAFTACQQGMLLAASAEGDITLTSKTENNVTVTVDGNSATVTDTEACWDVWDSKVLFETDVELEFGKDYKVSFELTGEENGVGEFFLCKSPNIDDRYHETFTNEDGNRSIVFTAAAPKLYVGMQVGNLGREKSVTLSNLSVCELSKSDAPNLLRTASCDVKVENGKIIATDNNDNNDVWNSKLLYDAGVELEVGKTYELDFNLSGANGVGEFFVCKSQDLNDRYDSTFVNAPGRNKVSFTAENTKLYIGMQFGNIGKGNSVEAVINRVGTGWPWVPPMKTAYTISAEDGTLVINATDLSDCNDVWDSFVLLDICQDLVPGQQYEISYELEGENGVGEFFLCKSDSLNNRYDSTWTNAKGLNTVVFTAEGTHAYVGMQLGNIGKENSVTVKVLELVPYNPAEGGKQGVRVAQNCDYDVTREVTEDADKTVISVTDTEANNDVWTSKLMYFFGNILETGKNYIAKINLAGSNPDGTVGEFFFLKSDNMDDRYSFDNTAGDHTVSFKADSEKLYAGIQFGNVGDGNDVVVTITDLFEKPFDTKYTDNCAEDMNRGSVTLTDTDDNNDIWNSKAVYNTGIVLEKGKEYTATFTLTGENGVGEFFFLKSDNIDERYSFDNTPGEHTITFVADDDAELFMGIQCGNIGNGNSVTVSNISVTKTETAEEIVVLVDDVVITEEAAPAEEAVVEEPVVEEAPVVEESSVVEAPVED